MFGELRDARKYGGDDEFGGNKLPEGELAGDDEHAADTKKGGAGDGLKKEGAGELAQKDAEVFRAVREVVADEFVAAVGGKASLGFAAEGE